MLDINSISELKTAFRNFLEKRTEALSDANYSVVTGGYGLVKTVTDTRVKLKDTIKDKFRFDYANHVKIDDKIVAIASQYPEEKMKEGFFHMLRINRTPLLIVLEPKADYFTPKKDKPNIFSSDEITVTSKKLPVKYIEGLEIDRYILVIDTHEKDKPIEVKILHVTNWLDRTAINKDQLSKLAIYINDTVKNIKKAYEDNGNDARNDSSKLHPVIHCKGGVGRTGQLIAGMQIMDPSSSASLFKICLDQRITRSKRMVEVKEQIDALVELTLEQKRALIKKADLSLQQKQDIRTTYDVIKTFHLHYKTTTTPNIDHIDKSNKFNINSGKIPIHNIKNEKIIASALNTISKKLELSTHASMHEYRKAFDGLCEKINKKTHSYPLLGKINALNITEDNLEEIFEIITAFIAPFRPTSTKVEEYRNDVNKLFAIQDIPSLTGINPNEAIANLIFFREVRSIKTLSPVILQTITFLAYKIFNILANEFKLTNQHELWTIMVDRDLPQNNVRHTQPLTNKSKNEILNKLMSLWSRLDLTQYTKSLLPPTTPLKPQKP